MISKDCCAEVWIHINYSFSDPAIWVTWSWQTLTSNVVLKKAWEEDTYPCFRVKSLKCGIGGFRRKGVMNLRRLVIWTKSLKFSIKASLRRIALTPGWSVFLLPNEMRDLCLKSWNAGSSLCSFREEEKTAGAWGQTCWKGEKCWREVASKLHVEIKQGTCLSF